MESNDVARSNEENILGKAREGEPLVSVLVLECVLVAFGARHEW